MPLLIPTPNISQVAPPGFLRRHKHCPTYKIQCQDKRHASQVPTKLKNPVLVTKTKRVHFTLPTSHVDKNSARWRQAPSNPNVQYRRPMTHSYAFAAKQLLQNINRPCNQPPPTMLLSTVDINLQNIRKWAILDSGASSHFLVTGAPVTNKKVATNPIVVTLPNGDQVHSTHTGDLNLP